MGETPLERWKHACDAAYHSVRDAHFEQQSDVAIEEATRLLGLAHHLKGVACPKCGGEGYRVYPDTSTWRHGIGGQAITEDICDKCWGTGRTDKTGPDLRKLGRSCK